MTSTYLLNKSSNTEKLYQRLLFGIFNIFNCYIDYFRDLPFRSETMFLPYVVAILINLLEVILAVKQMLHSISNTCYSPGKGLGSLWSLVRIELGRKMRVALKTKGTVFSHTDQP